MDVQEIQKLFAALGGVKPLRDRFHPLSDTDLSEIEARIGRDFPVTYRLFLADFGGVSFRKLVSVRADRTLASAATAGVEPVSLLFGADGEGFRSLSAKIALYHGQRRMPPDLLPIGENLFGDMFCLCVDGDDRGRIFFWDHHDERCEHDYWDVHGVDAVAPRDFLYGNARVVAESFDAYLKRLEKDQV